MEEMGFRKDASESVKEAFIKHLIRNATGISVQTPSEKRIDNPQNLGAKEGQQLSFNFSQDHSLGNKKVS